MRRLLWLLLALGCREPAPTAGAPDAAPPPLTLASQASWTIDRIHAQERAGDATCWTTTRMMDAFATQRPVTHHAAVLKTEALRTLVHARWLNGGDVLSLPPAFDQALDDQRRITEGWRAVLSVNMDAVGGVGLFAGRPPELPPLSPEAAERLADDAVRLNLKLLAAADAAATGRTIDVEALQAGFRALRAELGGDDPVVKPAPPRDLEALRALTRRNIDAKIASLSEWNRQGRVAPAELFGRYGPARFTEDGVRAVLDRLRPLAALVAAGADPQRADAELDNLMLARRRALPTTPRHGTLPWLTDVLAQVFPVYTRPNGDVLVDSTFDAGGQHIDHSVTLYASDLDAIRDTGLHWQLMRDAWRRPDASSLDPFAAELLAERLSELLFFHVVLYQQAAQRVGAPTIDAAFVRDPPIRNLLFLTDRPDAPTAARPWPAAAMARKETLLAGYSGPFFTDASAASGLARRAFVEYRPGPGPFRMHDKMGAGVAVGDFDRDGLPDLFLAGDGGNRLYRNLGERRFTDVTEAVGLDDAKLDDARQALFVDVEGDGLLDLLVVHSASPSRLFRQTAAGRYESAPAPKTGPGAHTATFLDHDLDGDLDLYVGHYASRDAAGHEYPTLDGRNGNANRFFRNDGGRFVDITAETGLGSTAWTLATTALDFDLDGDLDLYLANDFGHDELFANRGDGTFVEVGAKMGVDDRGSGMNASVTDIDGDGRLDLYVSTIDVFSKNLRFRFPARTDPVPLDQRVLRTTLYLSGNKLLRNTAAGFLPVEHRYLEPGPKGWSWGALFFDYENDGDEDLYLANGWAPNTHADAERNRFFLRAGDRLFATERDSPERYAGNSRGVAAVDLTGTGAVDLVANDFLSPARLLANRAERRGNWLKVKLKGPGANVHGVGATVRVHVGERATLKPVSCGDAYLAQADTTLHFGLGQAKAADRVEVIWPGGRRQEVPGPHPAGRTLEVTPDR